MPEGLVAGGFTRFRIQCNSSAANGQSVGGGAIATAGTTQELLIISLPSNGNATVFTVTEGTSKNHSYKIDPAGTLQISATGAHIDADFVEVLPAGSTDPVATFHMAGDLTCGTVASG